MAAVAKKKPKPEQSEPAKPVRYPSRDLVKYVGLPLNLYRALEEYADEHSDEDDRKSVAWAVRALVRKALLAEGRKIHPPTSRPEEPE